MLRWMIAVILVGAGLAGIALMGAKGAAAKAIEHDYRLVTATRTTYGIRQGFETTYKFFDGESLLWKQVTRDRYLKHWITPEGRVWIASGHYPGPGGGGHVTVRDAKGAGEALMYIYLSDLPLSGDRDFLAANLVRPRGSDVVEALEVKNGENVDRYIVLRSPTGVVRTFDPSLSHGRIDPSWINALYDKDAALPHLACRVDGWHSVWQSGKGYWLLEERILPYQKPEAPIGHSMVKRVPGAPTRAQLLPSSRKAWFLIDDGIVVLFDHDWNEMHRTDLLKLTGFKSPDELKENVDLGTLMSSNGYAWFDPSDRGSYQETVKFEQFELVDKRGRHIVWSVDARSGIGVSVSEEVLTGAAARHKAELDPAYSEPVTEASARSRSGRFVLRVRKYIVHMTGWEPHPKWVVTLLSNELGEDGSTIAVELWSRPTYTEVVAPFISDGGLSGYFSIGTYFNSKNKESFDSKACYLWHPSGQQLGGLELTKRVDSREVPYQTVKEARECTIVERTKFESSGTPSVAMVDGLELPVYPIEKFSIFRRYGAPIDYTYSNGRLLSQIRD